MFCVERGHTLKTRLIGLLRHREYPLNYVLWLYPCAAIHTFGMRFSLDLVFLDQDGRILKTVWEVSPNRLRICRDAVSVLEAQASVKSSLRQFKKGQCLTGFRVKKAQR